MLFCREEALLTVEIVKRRLVMRPDPFAEIIEQLDDGLRLFGGPVGGDQERKALGQAGG